jgi:2-polyprenyl-3-methyl-5-hydroxy-6-metoxy-1,4-benzoquinol methylase
LPTQSIDEHRYGKHTFSVVRGDATNAPHLNDGSFDIVFSNSVIEHVGEREKQAAFAKEVRRLAPSYFIQTPSIFFPLEAHTGLPLWWYYPESVRSRIIAHWRRTTPSYAEFVEGTRVLKKRDLRAFFPDAVIEPERVFGMTKSYLLWRR